MQAQATAEYAALKPLIDAIEAAEDRIDEAEANDEQPDPGDVRFVEENKSRVGLLMSPDQQERMKTEVATASADYIWMNPWKLGVAPGQNKTSKIHIDINAEFGRELVDAGTDGLLVCEMFMLGAKVERGDTMVAPPNGLFLGRFNINRPKDQKGPFAFRHTLEPMMNQDVLLDMVMSFVRRTDDRLRFLQLEFFAPDEKTYEWYPVARATFTIHYTFTSSAMETRYMTDGSKFNELSGEEKKKQILATMLAGQHVAAFKISPVRFETINDSADNPRPELASERAIYLFGDETKVYTPPTAVEKRDRDAISPGQEAEDLQGAILQSLEDEKGEQSGAGSSNTDPGPPAEGAGPPAKLPRSGKGKDKDVA